MKDYLLAIDIGTSGCKVCVFDSRLQVLAHTTKTYSIFYGDNGVVEQDPEDWWNVIICALKELSQKVDFSRIRAIGTDGQSWAAIPVDEKGGVLLNTPVWLDTRAIQECGEINACVTPTYGFALSGNTVRANYTLPKVLWFKNNKPEIFKKTVKILQSNAYIVFKLCGKISQDRSQGYGWQCYDIRQGKWDCSYCAKIGLDMSLLPEIYACDAVVGEILPSVAAITGLPVGTLVVAGGLDAACAALGAGVFEDGQVQENGGSAGGMSICVSSPKMQKDLILSEHVVPGRWLLQGGTVGGGGALRWFKENFSPTSSTPGLNAFEELSMLAARSPVGANGIIFLPYLNGERSPVWDANAKGVYFGLKYSNTKDDFTRAIMEGTAFSVYDNLLSAKEVGVTVSRMVATGGTANSDIWMQIKADICAADMVRCGSDHLSAKGAAILAGVGSGLFLDYSVAAEYVQYNETFYADFAVHAKYINIYKQYKKLYAATKQLMSEI